MSGIPDHVVIADQREAIERLRDRLDEWEQAHRIAVNDLGAKDEQHCSCVPFLRIEINRLRALIERLNHSIMEQPLSIAPKPDEGALESHCCVNWPRCECDANE